MYEMHWFMQSRKRLSDFFAGPIVTKSAATFGIRLVEFCNRRFLLLLAYRGEMLRRDVDYEYASQATKVVPWAKEMVAD